MSTLNSTVKVTLELPRELYERVVEVAQRVRHTPEKEMQTMLFSVVERQTRVRAAGERASASYRARLEREGKLNQTPEEVLAELAAIREELANELYPD